MNTVTIQDELYTMIPIEGTSGFTLTKGLVTGPIVMGTPRYQTLDSSTKPVIFKTDSLDKRSENISSVIKEFAGLLDEFKNDLKRLKIRHFLENSDAIQVDMPSLSVDIGALDKIVNAPYIISTQPSPSGSSSRD